MQRYTKRQEHFFNTVLKYSPNREDTMRNFPLLASIDYRDYSRFIHHMVMSLPHVTIQNIIYKIEWEKDQFNVSAYIDDLSESNIIQLIGKDEIKAACVINIVAYELEKRLRPEMGKLHVSLLDTQRIRQHFANIQFMQQLIKKPPCGKDSTEPDYLEYELIETTKVISNIEEELKVAKDREKSLLNVGLFVCKHFNKKLPFTIQWPDYSIVVSLDNILLVERK
ncbi:hypothetical protein SAMN05421780_108180 [Flexibacter flexilis DSM 6793]|uniref:Uncharacterized protein n=1 Tax=Flexibacter flexilis DSM 6793 TaxID=927664 RepID=A0A1I1LNI3_9BACT|nr:hypothetical protein [Flexibacter flexilis]SFC71020.1 hypothetical protein SAMN05421780_108180 [Flexibacter flexilis DSM 6793]